jgi:hypothetical protein
MVVDRCLCHGVLAVTSFVLIHGGSANMQAHFALLL